MHNRKITSSHLEELKKKRRKVVKIKTIIVIFLGILLFFGFYFLSKWKEINIQEIQIEGNKVLDKEKLENFILERIEGKYFYIFPKRSFLFTPRAKIKKDLSQNFRRIETLSFDVSDPKILKLNLTERVPLYTWCGEILDQNITNQTDQTCEFVDAGGYVFDTAPYFSGDVYFKFYGPLEDYYFAKNDFANLVLFVENIKRLSINPVALFALEDKEVAIYLSSNVPVVYSPKIILNREDDLVKLFQNLKAAIETDPLKSEFKEKYFSLNYLDLRFSNKVYYKFDESDKISPNE